MLLGEDTPPPRPKPSTTHDDLTHWLSWVEAEGEPPLVRAAETIDGVIAYMSCLSRPRMR